MSSYLRPVPSFFAPKLRNEEDAFLAGELFNDATMRASSALSLKSPNCLEICEDNRHWISRRVFSRPLTGGSIVYTYLHYWRETIDVKVLYSFSQVRLPSIPAAFKGQSPRCRRGSKATICPRNGNRNPAGRVNDPSQIGERYFQRGKVDRQG
ncbi:hypothetical protein V1478_006849 [Vespula squamosa]|uniref:Uncharacterized protein n=1 Tax=Vespula squamosa TaxID=30214 RepID=A0ABD2B1I0_VESSQ